MGLWGEGRSHRGTADVFDKGLLCSYAAFITRPFEGLLVQVLDLIPYNTEQYGLHLGVYSPRNILGFIYIKITVSEKMKNITTLWKARINLLKKIITARDLFVCGITFK